MTDYRRLPEKFPPWWKVLLGVAAYAGFVYSILGVVVLVHQGAQ
jgi:hypothetical protein